MDTHTVLREWRGHGLGGYLIGVPLAGFGMLLVKSAFFGGIRNANGEPLEWWAPVLVLLFGIPLLVAGVWVALGRQGVDIDHSKQSVIAWYGLLNWQLRKSTYRLNRNHCVRLEKMRSTSRALRWQVRVGGHGGMILGRFLSESAARACADRSASRLQLAIKERFGSSRSTGQSGDRRP